ncbi:hypothetical protein K503DRAFT_776694 [Rhizopogon vinicolor AM-OR11-026]|uniref:Uncharacterized protein n=1 Tax=Rhizopogon vinicolor AM-OR11-026 TaxID=1314800 RepID=A0A1B7MIH4_9AGAM|nr:hypothetical protein K503DRAFT_776694 [Rhizopogon vinicolor AM-OR11-026]
MANDPCNKGDNDFSFAPRQPTWCHGWQHVSTVQNRLSLDHISSRLEGELQTRREAAARLILLSMSKNDIRNTFGAPEPVLLICTVTTNLEHISALKYISPFPLEPPALSELCTNGTASDPSQPRQPH